MTLFYFLFHAICDMYIFFHFYCYGMRSAMLQINEYDDDDDDLFLLPSHDFPSPCLACDRFIMRPK